MTSSLSLVLPYRLLVGDGSGDLPPPIPLDDDTVDTVNVDGRRGPAPRLSRLSYPGITADGSIIGAHDEKGVMDKLTSVCACAKLDFFCVHMRACVSRCPEVREPVIQSPNGDT